MGKKIVEKTKEKEISKDNKEENKEEVTKNAGEEEGPLRVEIGNTPATKGLMDDTIAALLEDEEIEEDRRVLYLRHLLGLVSILFALFAQCYPHPLQPLPYPQARNIYIVCVAAYFFISFLLTAISVFVEKDIVIFTKPCKTLKLGLHISTTLNRFSTEYHVVFRNRANGKTLFEKKLQLTDYFEADGVFHDDFLKEDLLPPIKSLMQKAKSE